MTNSTALTIADEDDAVAARFRAASERLADFMNADGKITTAFSSFDLPYLNALEITDQLAALRRIETMVKVCLETLECGHSISDTSALVSTLFRHTDYQSAPSLFERLEADDSVELYHLDHTSFFMSTRTLSVVSLSIEELYCRKWTEFLSRDVRGVHESLLQLSIEMVEGKHLDLVSTQYIPDHVCREYGTPALRSIIMFPRFFAPLFRGAKVAGYLCSNKLFPHVETQP